MFLNVNTQIIVTKFLHVVPVKPPEEIGATSLSSTTIMLSWSPPLPEYQNGIIILYRINLTTPQNVTQHYTTADTNITITGLMPHTLYSCAIAAENSAGVGPYSSPVAVQTAEAGKIHFKIML